MTLIIPILLLLAASLFSIIICISARPKAIIFIGPYKTGSSTIAEHLRANRDNLRRKNVYVPESECDDRKAGSGIKFCLGVPLTSRTLISSLVKNGHKERFGEHDQLLYHFRLYLEDQNCKTVEKIRYYSDQDEYWASFDKHKLVISNIQVTNEEVKKDALQTHKVLYGLEALYPDEVKWLYPNEALSLDAINNFKYEELSRESVRNDKNYRDAFHDMMAIGVRRKEIEC